MQAVAKGNPSALAARLRAFRQAVGMTQAEVAAHVEVGYQTYMRWERGDTEPTYSQLLDLAAVFGVTFESFAPEKKNGAEG